MNKKLSTLLFEEDNIDNIFENSEGSSKQITSPLNKIYNKIKNKSPNITLSGVLLTAITEDEVKNNIEAFLEIANEKRFITTGQHLYRLIEQFINTDKNKYYFENKNLPQVSRYFLKSNTENSITFKEFIEYVRKASAGEVSKLKLNQIELCLSNVYKHIEDGYKDLAEKWSDPAEPSTDEKAPSKEEQTQEKPSKESSSTEEQDKEAIDEDVVEANEEQFRSELVNLLVEVDKEFQQKADEIATKAAESKDTRQKVGFSIGAIGGAALGLTAAVSMGPIGLLAFGPAIVAGSTGLGAFGLGTLVGATAKDVDAKGSVKAQIDKDSKILLDEIIKLISKELQEESFIYRSRLSSLLFEQETKNKQIQWEKIEKILKAKGIGPYKAALKGSVSDSQLDEMIAFSSALVDIIEKNFPVKVANFNYKFSLDDLVKKRNEAARQRSTMNMKAKTGQPINAGFDAMIDQLLAQPNISEGTRNKLLLLKIMNNSGARGIEKLTSDTLSKVLEEAGNPSKDYDLSKKASEIFGLSENVIEQLTKNSSSDFSEFPNKKALESFVLYYEKDLMGIIKDFKNEFKNKIDKDYEFEIDKGFLKKVSYYSNIKKGNKIEIKERNPLTCILQSLFTKLSIGQIENSSNNSSEITQKYYKKIIDLISDKILNKSIDVQSDSLDEEIKKIFGLEKTANESISLKSKNLLEEEWLRIWEIEK